MGVGAFLCMYDVVVKSSRSLSHLLMSSCLFYTTTKPQHVTSHVFAEITHVIAAPHGFACVAIPPT